MENRSSPHIPRFRTIAVLRLGIYGKYLVCVREMDKKTLEELMASAMLGGLRVSRNNVLLINEQNIKPNGITAMVANSTLSTAVNTRGKISHVLLRNIRPRPSVDYRKRRDVRLERRMHSYKVRN